MHPLNSKASLLASLMLSALFSTWCAPAWAEQVVAAAPTPEMAQVATAEQRFALDLYASMSAGDIREGDGGKNLFFSPLSVYSVMAMAAEGANGQTAEQMAMALGLDPPGAPGRFAGTHEGLVGIADGLRGDGGKLSHLLLAANAVWVDRSFPLAAGYQRALAPYLRSAGGVFACDFHNRYDAEARRLDAWCGEQTRGRITSIMPPLSAEEAKALHLVLTNAVYFEGKWVTPFEPKDTQRQRFLLADGGDVETEMMRRWSVHEGRYGAVDAQGEWFATPAMYDPDVAQHQQQLYPAGKGFTLAEIPYKGGRLSMLLLLPREPEGLGHIEELLTPQRLSDWVSRMEARNISTLRLPKVDLATRYDMTRQLAGLGMELAFTRPSDGKGADGNGADGKGADGRGADFSRMVDSSDPDLRLYLGLVVHKATLEIDEQGTVAAAATVVAPMAPSPAEAPTTLLFSPQFVADHPFLMLIRDNPTGAILFMGRIDDPRSAPSEG